MPYWLQYDVFGAFGLLFGQIIFCEKRQDYAKKNNFGRLGNLSKTFTT